MFQRMSGVVAALTVTLTLGLVGPVYADGPEGSSTESASEAGGAEGAEETNQASGGAWWMSLRRTEAAPNLAEFDAEYRLSHRVYKGFPTGQSGALRENGELVHSGMIELRFGGYFGGGEGFIGFRGRFEDHDDSSTWNNSGRVRLSEHPFNESTAAGGLSFTYRLTPQGGVDGNRRLRLELNCALMGAQQEGLVQSRTMPRVEAGAEIAYDLTGNGFGLFTNFQGMFQWDITGNNTTQMEGRLVGGFRWTGDGVRFDLYGGVRSWDYKAHDRGQDRFSWDGFTAVVGASLQLGPIELFAECHILGEARMYHRSVHDNGGTRRVNPIGGRGSTVEGGARLRF